MSSPLLLLLGAGWLMAQGIPQEMPDYTFYGIDRGLPSRVVWSTTRDADGLLWLGTDNGIARFDGYSFQTFPEVSQTFNGRIAPDDTGQLVSLHSEFADSVEIFDRQTFTATGYRLAHLREEAFVDRFHQPGEAVHFWAGTSIFRLGPAGTTERVHSLATPGRAGDRLVHADADGYILLDAAQNRLRIAHRGALTTLDLPDYDPEGMVYRDGKGSLWLSAHGKLYRWSARRTAFTAVPGLAGGATINFIAEDRHRRLIFGRAETWFLRDVIAFDETGFHPLPWLLRVEDRIVSITGDDFSRDLRMSGHTGMYLVRFLQPSDNPFESFLSRPLKPGKFGQVMRGFVADDAGNVYVNKDSYSPHWFRVDATTRRLDTLVLRDNQGRVAQQNGCGTNLLNYRGDIYGMNCIRAASTIGHLYRYRPADNSWKRWTLPDTNLVARAILRGSGPGELFVVCEQEEHFQRGAIYRFFPDQDSFARVPTAVVSGRVKVATYDDRRRQLWIGSLHGGLMRWDIPTGRFHHHAPPGGHALHVTDIDPAIDGKLYVSTINDGLHLYDPAKDRFTHVGGQITPGHRPPAAEHFVSLPSNSIAGLHVTPEGYLLIATFKGLVLRGADGRVTTFTTAHGLVHNEFNTSSLYYHAAAGRYYAGGINGFVSFDLADLAPDTNEQRPALISYNLLDVAVGFETVQPLPAHPTTPLVVPPSVVYFSLNFTLPDYTNPNQNRYQTRLVGYDPDWTPPTLSHSVRYTRLPPGDYTFELRATNADGAMAQQTLLYPIRVLTPWYRGNAFYALVLVGLLGLWVAFDRRRLARIHRELAYERRVYALEQRALRQQLNPHFIFNAMGAIKEYILNADRQRAAGYLTDFSRLMRRFLEASRNRYTTIEDEIELLERYIRLEQLRFPGRFSCTVEVDPDIDRSMEELPSLLLQPIVENAILHGLRNLDDGTPGLLHLSINRDPTLEETLVCTVTDNGVGRAAAARLKAESLAASHISRAQHILEERRALLAEDDTVRIAIFTDDLYPERPATGTVVTLLVSWGTGPLPDGVAVTDPFVRAARPL